MLKCKYGGQGAGDQAPWAIRLTTGQQGFWCRRWVWRDPGAEAQRGSPLLLCPLQGAAHLQHEGPRLPDRPQHQEKLAACEQARRYRVLLLRQHTQRLPDHQPGRNQGGPTPHIITRYCYCKHMQSKIVDVQSKHPLASMLVTLLN